MKDEEPKAVLSTEARMKYIPVQPHLGLSDVMKIKCWADQHPELVAAITKVASDWEALSTTPEGKVIVSDIKALCSAIAKLP